MGLEKNFAGGLVGLVELDCFFDLVQTETLLDIGLERASIEWVRSHHELDVLSQSHLVDVVRHEEAFQGHTLADKLDHIYASSWPV